MKQKLQEYALVAEIISAICIVLSLIFVGLQVRQGAQETQENSVALRSQVQQAMMEADKDLLLFRALNGRTMEGRDLFYYGNALFRSRELYWTQHNVGLLDDAAYLAYMTPFVAGGLNSEEIAAAWILAVDDGYVQPEFVAEVNRLREQLGQPAIEYLGD